MTADEREDLYQFLASNWYDREENDSEIVGALVSEADPEYITESLNLIQIFLADPESTEEKSEFVRHAVWRYIPEGTDAPIEWLKKIQLLLNQTR